MPGNPLTDPHWAADLADTIDLYIGKVRTAVTERAVTVVRAVVFGLIILIVAPVAITLVVIIVTKSLQRLIATVTDHDTAVWLSYMFIAAVLIIAGSVLMGRRYLTDDQQ
jgi:H+/Cl- antiporter ClcA